MPATQKASGKSRTNTVSKPRPSSLSGWVLLLTTLPSERWSNQQIADLYRARWHIELVFKRIKQLLKQQGVRCTTAATALPTITALLLGWALVEEESSVVRQAICEAMECQEQAQGESPGPQERPRGGEWQKKHTGPLSEWMLAEVSTDLLCQQIRGSYTAAQYRARLPRLHRFLGSGHRQRPHRYSQVCRWLASTMTSLPVEVQSA